MGVTFGTWGLDWWEHTAIDGSLYRPTEIAVGRGNPGKAMIKLGRQRYAIKFLCLKLKLD